MTDVMFALSLLSSGRSGGRVVGVVAMFFILLFGIGCGIKAASSGRGVLGSIIATTGLDAGLRCAPERCEANVSTNVHNGCTGLSHITDTSCTWWPSDILASTII